MVGNHSKFIYYGNKKKLTWLKVVYYGKRCFYVSCTFKITMVNFILSSFTITTTSLSFVATIYHGNYFAAMVNLLM